MLTEKKLAEIIATYDTPEMRLSAAFKDGGMELLWERFQRSASNQMDAGAATVSRYAIWATTVRDTLVEARRLMRDGRIESADALMVRGINSLSAFADVQADMDEML